MSWQTEIVSLPDPDHLSEVGDNPPGGAAQATSAAQFRRWENECARAFLRGRHSDDSFAVRVRNARYDGRIPRQVVEKDAQGDGNRIVGTFCEYPWRLDLGRGEVPFWAITSVTVRPTHRRRGMLRDMLTASLERAVTQGMPMAGLTVSEGGIYGRFGVGPAGSLQSAEIDTRAFVLRRSVPGEVVLVEPAELEDHFEDLAALTRRAWPGVFPMGAQRTAALAQWDAEAERVPADRYAAVHRDERGQFDGAVVWSVVIKKDGPPTLVVHSLWGAPTAVWALIAFCCSIDLVEVVRIPFSPPIAQVRAVTVDPRAVRLTDHTDALWLRPLDVPACVEARPWGANGQVTLAVTDPLGHAAGTWQIFVEEGVASAQPTAAEPMLTVDVDTLGCLLGDGRLGDLVTAGRVHVRDDTLGDLESLERIVGGTPTAWHNVHF